MVNRWWVWVAAVVACGMCPAAGAVDLMTGDGYLYAISQDEHTRAEAEHYASGTLETLIVLNEVLTSEGTPLFCLSDDRADAVNTDRLRAEFADWLKAPGKTSVTDEQLGALPVSVLGWGFLSARFACAKNENRKDDLELRSRLLDSMRK